MQTQFRTKVLSVLALVLLVGLAMQGAWAQKESKAVMAARELDQQLVDAVNARDVDNMMSQYWNSPELFVLTEYGRVTKGWEAFKNSVARIFGAVEAFSLSAAECQYWESGDGILGTCAFKMNVKLKGGGEINQLGWYTVFRRKLGGKWLIVFEHASANAPARPGPTTSLYKRLGGYDAIAAVVDDFIPRLIDDPQLARFFGGVSANSAKRIRQLVVDQLCAATGGPCVYTGRDMKSSHAGLGITGRDWDLAVSHLMASLDKFRVPAKEKGEVLAAVSGLKPDIVEK